VTVERGARLEALYGLPETVAFCKKCVMSNQRPSSAVEYDHTITSKKQTLHFDEKGVCDACNWAQMKDETVDWAARERELRDLCDRYRRTDGRYDVICPGSGGKDSMLASHVLKHKYGMHPLTVTWAPHIYTDIGWKNFQAWTQAGFDNVKFTPNGKVHRLLTKLAVENLLHPFQPFIIGQKMIGAKFGIMYDVPLVFYGENEAEYGNPIADNSTAIRSEAFYTRDQGDLAKVFLGGVSAKQLIEEHALDANDLAPYLPPTPDAVKRWGGEVRYLGYYLKWTPQWAYYYAVENLGFEANPERTEGTYSKYNSLDDRIDGFHYYTTYIKFGLGRATYDAAQEIRNHHITREEGVALVRRFDGEYPKRYSKQIMEYLDMTEEHFLELCDRFRSPHLWERTSDGWRLRHQVS
jgi:N-acetyl sugar amidotransferase